MDALLTVGVACYNIEQFIAACLDSVLAQTYRNLEILVVDDGSTDGAGDICDAYAKKDARIRVIHQENRGLGGARNTVIREAKGEYIAFVDGDDRIDPGMYETLLSFLEEEALDIAICAYRTVSVGEYVQPVRTDREAKRFLMDRETLLEYMLLENNEVYFSHAAWNKLYRVSLIGDLRFPEHQKFEDIVYTAKLFAKADNAGFIDLPLYYYTSDRQGSIMNQGVGRATVEEQLDALNKRHAFLAQTGRTRLLGLHDYHGIKKALLFYTDARRSRDPEVRRYMKGIAAYIRQARGRMDEIYSSREADPHEKMRTQLFLIHPVLYNLFMDVNEGFVLPLRRRLGGS